jgi:hypothetical protein
MKLSLNDYKPNDKMKKSGAEAGYGTNKKSSLNFAKYHVLTGGA